VSGLASTLAGLLAAGGGGVSPGAGGGGLLVGRHLGLLGQRDLGGHELAETALADVLADGDLEHVADESEVRLLADAGGALGDRPEMTFLVAGALGDLGRGGRHADEVLQALPVDLGAQRLELLGGVEPSDEQDRLIDEVAALRILGEHQVGVLLALPANEVSVELALRLVALRLDDVGDTGLEGNDLLRREVEQLHQPLEGLERLLAHGLVLLALAR